MAALFENETYRKHLAAGELPTDHDWLQRFPTRMAATCVPTGCSFKRERNLRAPVTKVGVQLTLFMVAVAPWVVVAGPATGRSGPATGVDPGTDSHYGARGSREQPYDDESIAHHLEQLVNAVLLSSGRHYPKEDEWAAIMETLSVAAYPMPPSGRKSQFRALLSRSYPIDHVDQLNIGSRPARRHQKTEAIFDLRAILSLCVDPSW
ncbi:MAG: phosphoenolpyruvate carboxylase [Caldilineaceae bacterium]